jgi:hypothetical protein
METPEPDTTHEAEQPVSPFLHVAGDGTQSVMTSGSRLTDFDWGSKEDVRQQGTKQTSGTGSVRYIGKALLGGMMGFVFSQAVGAGNVKTALVAGFGAAVGVYLHNPKKYHWHIRNFFSELPLDPE